MRGCWARTSRRISPCGKEIRRLTACSPVASSLTTPCGTSMSVRMVGSCEPPGQSTRAASGITCHIPGTAVLAHSSNDARAHRSKKIARDVNEDARNHARSLKGTPEFERSSTRSRRPSALARLEANGNGDQRSTMKEISSSVDVCEAMADGRERQKPIVRRTPAGSAR